MTPIQSYTIPDQGQLVEVRNRRFVVVDVEPSTLPGSSFDRSVVNSTHLVTLSSIEDDALGEELQVIWEIEAQKSLADDGAFPAPIGFDPPSRFDGFLNAIRWGANVTADGRMIQAPFRSGIEIEDYQLDPVVRAIQMPRANLLIADDVGLGKTIEAGLVLQELVIRQRVRTVLIVCPASLQIQWRDQMRDKFGLEFRIINSDMMRELRRVRGIRVNPWSHFPRLITSIDYLKRDHPMRLMRETLPGAGESIYPRRYDLLIVDEAHNVAPSGRGRYAVDSLRTKAIRTLTPHFEHRLFLTATPHNGYAESFSALLELLDNQRFARGVMPERETLSQVMVRRLKSDLPPDDLGRPRFPSRTLKAIEVDFTSEEREAHQLLQRYARARRANARDNVERTANEFVLKLLKKRLFSSPAAFAKTLAQHRLTVEKGAQQATKREPGRPSAGILRARLETYEEEYADDQELAEGTETALYTADRYATPLTPAERTLLEKLSDWANNAALRADSKARKLIDWLKTTIRPKGQWANQRVIIFSEYRDTQNWLQSLLAAEGLTKDGRLMVLHGGLNSDEREGIKAAFLTSPEVSNVRILLATDAASEGIDLQRHCHRLIHYEIPWNPNRLEQRNGRIDRHGQSHHPEIYHFAPSNYGKRRVASSATQGDALFGISSTAQPEELQDLDWDLEFLMLVVAKVEQIREDLGRVGPVIADQVIEAMLGQRHELQTDDAESAAAPARRMLQFERDLDVRIQRLHEQLFETKRELAISGQNIKAVVDVALQLAGQPALQETAVDGVWPDPTGRRHHCPVFDVPALSGPSWARCTEGLLHPHTGVQRPIVFDHDLARGRDDVVLAHLNHRLVQMSLRLLRAQAWSNQGQTDLHRVVARMVPDSLLQHPAMIGFGRLVVTGGDSQRLHEEVIYAGGEIRQQRFRRFDTQARLNEVMRAASPDAVPTSVTDQLTLLWDSIEQPLLRSLEARMEERTRNLDSILDRRRDKELADIGAVLGELERSIRAELDTEPQQLSLFNQDERDQYIRNVSALEARLAQIPVELAEEEELIRRRYAAPEPRLFPVAVMFLIPKRIARG
ncbi:MAG: DISARM system SNF2-like helicase DrmD [Caldilineaceae bacterium]|nr:DISARM system SNF2-like helicase DrmD [Caldilineaceae bacterium]